MDNAIHVCGQPVVVQRTKIQVVKLGYPVFLNELHNHCVRTKSAPTHLDSALRAIESIWVLLHG